MIDQILQQHYFELRSVIAPRIDVLRASISACSPCAMTELAVPRRASARPEFFMQSKKRHYRLVWLGLKIECCELCFKEAAQIDPLV